MAWKIRLNTVKGMQHSTQCLLGNKCSWRLVSIVVISVIIIIKHNIPPGRKSANIHLVFSLFWYLTLRTHKTEILIPILKMREVRLRKSGQLTVLSLTELVRAKPESLTQESVSYSPWPNPARCLFYVCYEWFLHFLKSCKTSKEG